MDIKQKWSDLINRVEHAGDQQHKMIKFQQKHRMQVLKYQLLDQINQKKQFENERNINKHRQRQEIQQLIKQQNLKQLQSRKKKKQLQQNYQIKNQNLMLTPKNSERADVVSSPFDKIIIDCSKRQQALKDKFKWQNQINSMQAEINKQKKKSKQKQQKEQSQKFINHVQQQYIKRQTDRQRFKQKYLKNGFPDPINQQGLEQQRATMRKSYKQKEHQIDPTMQKYNSKIQNSFNSPAYLGKNALAFDRQVQLKFLDRQLGLNNQIYENKMRLYSQGKEDQKGKDNYERFQSFSRSKNKMKTEGPDNYQSGEQNTYSTLSVYDQKDFMINKQINLNKKEAQTSRRSYFQYNAITGGKTQFIA